MKNATIGIHGLAEVGKDTAAIILCDELNLRTYVIAEPVTIECAALLGIEHDEFLSINKNKSILNRSILLEKSIHYPLYSMICSEGKQKLLATMLSSPTKRKLMQNVGDCLIALNKYALIDMLKHRLDCDEIDADSYNGSLITDVRTPEEAAFIHQRGGFIIHIRNPNADPAPMHRTEQQLLPIPGTDYEINNNGSKAEFEHKILELSLEISARIADKAA